MSASVVSHNLYDLFGVLRHQQGSAQTPWRLFGYAQVEEEMLYVGTFLLQRDRPVLRPMSVLTWLIGCAAICGLLLWRLLKFWDACKVECFGQDGANWIYCMASCLLRKVCKEGLDGPISQALCMACGGCIVASLPVLKPAPVPIPVPVPIPGPVPIPIPPCFAYGGVVPARACAMR
ncbi:MAG: hypothetical protein KatS3mg023_1951 [Armatimonadota bacterium]|nr:MAG: hypothetical protein KatS3mg023_1951 [Armatimonadota bacterium]